MPHLRGVRGLVEAVLEGYAPFEHIVTEEDVDRQFCLTSLQVVGAHDKLAAYWLVISDKIITTVRSVEGRVLLLPRRFVAGQRLRVVLDGQETPGSAKAYVLLRYTYYRDEV